jgi:hypothetical protein
MDSPLNQLAEAVTMQMIMIKMKEEIKNQGSHRCARKPTIATITQDDSSDSSNGQEEHHLHPSVEEKEPTKKIVFPQDQENNQEDSSFDKNSTNLTHIGYNAPHHRVHQQPNVAEVQLLSEGQPRINNALYN